MRRQLMGCQHHWLRIGRVLFGNDFSLRGTPNLNWIGGFSFLRRTRQHRERLRTQWERGLAALGRWTAQRGRSNRMAELLRGYDTRFIIGCGDDEWRLGQLIASPPRPVHSK